MEILLYNICILSKKKKYSLSSLMCGTNLN
nr:MAG TPA_asm: hypothetical protein [Caudoviricetes sp.]